MSAAVCPRDGVPLVEVERSGVQIDACPTCRGIWLDRGELDKLIDLEAAAASDDDFLSEVTGKRTDSERRTNEHEPTQTPHKSKGEGFLQNFLDFGGE